MDNRKLDIYHTPCVVQCHSIHVCVVYTFPNGLMLVRINVRFLYAFLFTNEKSNAAVFYPVMFISFKHFRISIEKKQQKKTESIEKSVSCHWSEFMNVTEQ